MSIDSRSFTLRPFQLEALSALEAPGHLIAVAHTGAGKSLIYERAAAVPGRRTLLVSPLVALARQQAQRLRAAGLRTALGIGGEGERPDGESQVWILSPESLLTQKMQAALKTWRPDFLVVDECHCLWDWGEHFRTSFQLLPELIRDSAERIQRSLWLTATLPPIARLELKARLPAPVRELGSFELPPQLQLELRRVRWPDRAEALVKFLAGNAENRAGIIFTLTRESTYRLEKILRARGLNPLIYHAGHSAEERRALEAIIRKDTRAILIATSAFGMGMDQSHLRWVVLWQAPPSLLSLAQMIGRVARDPNEKAQALVLWASEDFSLMNWTLGQSLRRREELTSVRHFLEASGCPRLKLKAYFEGGQSEAPAFPRII